MNKPPDSQELRPRAKGRTGHMEADFRLWSFVEVDMRYKPRFNRVWRWHARPAIIIGRIRHWPSGAPIHPVYRPPILLIGRRMCKSVISQSLTSFDYDLMDQNGRKTWVGEENLRSYWPGLKMALMLLLRSFVGLRVDWRWRLSRLRHGQWPVTNS